MTCQCKNGTVWFDHKAGKWKHAHSDSRPCTKPMPKGATP